MFGVIVTSSAIDKMFEIFGPIFEQNVTINFEPIFEQNANFGPIFEKSAYFGPIFEKSVNFEHFVNGKWSHYKEEFAFMPLADEVYFPWKRSLAL